MLVTTEAQCFYGASLLDEELDPGDSESALRIIDVNHCFSDLLGRIDILLVVGPHSRGALVDAAPRSDLRLLHLPLVHLEGNGRLSYRKHLLVLHFLAWVRRFDRGLHVVFDLCFRVFADLLIFKIDRARHSHRQLELE